MVRRRQEEKGTGVKDYKSANSFIQHNFLYHMYITLLIFYLM